MLMYLAGCLVMPKKDGQGLLRTYMTYVIMIDNRIYIYIHIHIYIYIYIYLNIRGLSFFWSCVGDSGNHGLPSCPWQKAKLVELRAWDVGAFCPLSNSLGSFGWRLFAGHLSTVTAMGLGTNSWSFFGISDIRATSVFLHFWARLKGFTRICCGKEIRRGRPVAEINLPIDGGPLEFGCHVQTTPFWMVRS